MDAVQTRDGGGITWRKCIQKKRNVRHDGVPSSFRFLAFGACPEDLQTGTLRREILLAADLFLNAIQAFIDELDEITAFETDQMMVMRASEGFLISRAVLCEPVLGDESAFLQKVEGVVDGGLGNLCTAGDHAVIEAFCVEMPLALEDGIEDGDPG
jgi:hypothetical protein